MLEQTERHFRALVQPALQFLYALEFEKTEEALIEARAQLANLSLEPAVREAVAIRLQVAAFHLLLRRLARADDESVPSVSEMLQRYNARPETEHGRAELARLRLVIITACAHMQQPPYPQEEVLAAFDAVPAPYLDFLAWQQVSAWAFRFNHLPLLEAASEYALRNGSGHEQILAWRLIFFRYQLASGRLTRGDIRATIGSLVARMQAEDFYRAYWPRLEAAGLLDEELREQMRIRLEVLRNTQPGSQA